MGTRSFGPVLPVRLAKQVTLAVLAAALGAGLAGCSSAALDSPYPAVHDMPAVRQEPPMTPDQLKRTTDDLVSDRNKLSAEAQAATTASVPPPAPAQPAPTAAAKPQKTGAGARP